jgi:hypothetical protein
MIKIFEKELTEQEIAEREAWVAGAHDRAMEDVRQARQSAYERFADPLFFKFQAGEATKEDWLSARKEVLKAHPYPAQSK